MKVCEFASIFFFQIRNYLIISIRTTNTREWVRACLKKKLKKVMRNYKIIARRCHSA